MVLTRLRFFRDSPQGTEPDATGYKGFYYHFLDMKTGRRSGRCELSTIDTTFLLAGMLAAATYFDRDSADEHEIRTLADALYRRVDWRWAQDGGATVTHGWTPEGGFLPYRWQGYDEALLLYVLGLGSPTYPLPEESYSAWASTYQWRRLYGHEFLYSGPLFTHQLSHIWIDFRGIQDAFMRDRGIDYFENSRRATYVQQEYAIRNPLGFEGYGGGLLGDHGQRRARLDGPQDRRHRAAFLRLYRARRALRARRRDDRPVGGGRLAAVRAGDRAADDRAFHAHGSGRVRGVRLPLDVQPDLQARRGRPELGVALSLRDRPGADRPDDRELPDGPASGD